MAKLSQQASQAKTQKSISNFFTPKSTPASQPSQSLPPAQKVLETGSDEEEDVAQSPVLRPKRALAEDTSGGNGGFERPAKKLKADISETTSNRPKPSPRTEKYVYTGSSQITSQDAIPEADGETVAEKAKKRELHERWMKKMNGVQIGRRWNTEEKPAAEDGDSDDGEEEEVPVVKAKKKGAKTGKLTPLELQVLDIKRKHMDTLLIIEVGYKFKFFGEDARTAAKELSIVCIPGKFRYDEHPSEAHLDRFASASIPVHRLPVHAKRLVAAGHKIGVVRQIETAALKKAGDNRNTPFIRKLTNVYTKGTYIDDVDGLDEPATDGAPATGYLLCITEAKSKGYGTDEKVDVGILAVQPATGDIIYDIFEDGFMRNEIETRLLHLAPCEFLIVGDLTKATEKLVQHLSGSSTNVFGDRIRVERVKKQKTFAAEAHSHVTQFYADKLKATQDNIREQTLLDKVLKLPEEVTMCLSAMITHMTEYGLEHVFDLTKYFQSFSARSHMLLNGNTLTSLEIYQNSTDQSARGSLFWTLDRTQTRFGQRLLRKWVGKPLLDQADLEERLNAVEELAEGNQTPKVDKIRALLRNIKSDLERSLIRIYYNKCTRPELLISLQTLQRISQEYAHIKGNDTTGFMSPVISSAISSLPTILPTLISILDKINAEAARKDDKYAFFREEYETDTISDHKLGIAAVEQELDAHRAVVKEILHSVKAIQYTTVAGIEYLVEVPNIDSKDVPASWSKISGTKKVARFHTPEVIRLIRERDQHKESLSAACDVAFRALLIEISAYYALLRDAVSSLATLDCLLSLATVAMQPGYVKPSFITPSTPTHAEINISLGRHPMIEQLLAGSYIPNSTSLSTLPSSSTQATPTPKAQLITGPNMGGKSSYVRQTALLCLLAQIGSFVPAESMSLTPLTSIHTRMGAYDSLFTGQSTFQCELSETSTILSSLPTTNPSSTSSQAPPTSSITASLNPRSLVILDELGRGTSTHDGTAIAGAVLDYIVRSTSGCLLLFITHYQSLASVARGFETGGELQNVHMGFTATSTGDADHAGDNGDEEITFLYEVTQGVAHRSYGLNVARLANIPKAVLETAAEKSRELEMEVRERKLGSLRKVVNRVLMGESGATEDSLQQLIMGIEEL